MINASLHPITRVDIKPLRCSIESPMPQKPRDPREQDVRSRAVSPAPPIDLYRVTPESLSWAKAAAAIERADVERQRLSREKRRQEMAIALASFVDEFGFLAVRFELERLEER